MRTPDARFADLPGVAYAPRCLDWRGLRTHFYRRMPSPFVASGLTDPVLGPPVMNALRKLIRNCPEPYVHAKGGHFLQEWGEDIAREALNRWQ